MWNRVMGKCSQTLIADIERDDRESKRVLGTVNLLTELIRIDVKGRAEPRQVRNLDISKRVANAAFSLED